MKILSSWYWIRDMVAPGSNPADGVYLYSESGVAKVRQSDGTIIPIVNVTEIDSVTFDGGDPTTDHTVGDSVILDAGGVV